MTEILQTNIFFFITSVAVVSVTILIGLVLFYVVLILKDIKEVSDKVKKGIGFVGRDLAVLRKEIKKGNGKVQGILGLLLNRFFSVKKEKKSAKREEEN